MTSNILCNYLFCGYFTCKFCFYLADASIVLAGLGWSICNSYSWRSSEVEVPWDEFCGLSVWGLMTIFNYFVLNGLVIVKILFWNLGFVLYVWLLQLTNDNRQLVFLYERGKKKLMDGARIAFTGNMHFNFHDDLVHCVVILFVS